MNKEIVKLTLPAKKEYLLPIRLFISGIATRAGFSLDQIENTKLAAAEACSCILTKVQSEEIEIRAEIGEDIQIYAAPIGHLALRTINDEDAMTLSLSRFMLEGLAQDVSIEEDTAGLLTKIEFCMKKQG